MVWRFALMACALGAFSVVPAPALAGDLPTAADLLAKVKAATGARPPSYEEHVTTTTPGSVTRSTILRSGEDRRDIDDSGPLHSESGRFQKQAWEQNENGQTYLEQPPPSDEPGGPDDRDSNPAGMTVSRVAAPIDAFVLSRTNADGIAVKLYVDPSSYHIVRREAVRGKETVVTIFDDFRTTGGYTRAWHRTIRDGRPEDDEEDRVESFVARPIADTELAIPGPRRRLVQFPAGKTSVDLPARLEDDSWVVRVTIAGRDYDFGLDSGSSGITIDDATAKRLGLQAVSHFVNTANAGRYKSSTIIVPAMSIGDLRMTDVVVDTVPTFEAGPTVKIAGLIGFDFIAELALQLDYQNGIARALPGGTNVIGGSNAITLDIRLRHGIPETTLIVNGQRGDRFVLDTGAEAALFIGYAFAHDHPKAIVDRGGGSYERYWDYSGIGGYIDAKPVQLALVELGPLHFIDFVGHVIRERTQYSDLGDGLIGARMLSHFTVWLDYANSHVVLIPNKPAG
jgi:predicted aspartyl protease